MARGIVLDHVAHAVRRHDDVLHRYAGALGARFHGMGEGPGFSPLQVRFANGAKVEVLQPHAVEQFPFLQRFLDRRGPGLHHVTFKVPDIEAVIAELTATGHRVVDVNLDWDEWKEAFVHPSSAHGFLVQVAQAKGDMPSSPPARFPDPTQAADLVRLVLAVADLDGARTLYEKVLGGQVVDDGERDGRWVELDCGSAMRVRVWSPAEPAVLAGAPGRALHLELSTSDPSSVPGAAPSGDRWVVGADANSGTPLVLSSPDL